MKRNRFLFVPVVVCSMIFSCAKYIDDPIPIDTSKRWLGYKQNHDDTIAVRNGYVYLTTHHAIAANGTSIISNNKLKGDFEVKITYSSFVASGSNSFSDQLFFKLSHAGVQYPLIAAFLTNDDIYLQDSTNVGLSKNSVNRDGEFYIKREGSSIYSWIRAGSDSLFLDKVNYFANDLTIEVGVYSADNTATNTSARIEDITVTGGGGFVKSNTFNDNTIQIVE